MTHGRYCRTIDPVEGMIDALGPDQPLLRDEDVEHTISLFAARGTLARGPHEALSRSHLCSNRADY
jgi:hypothetical protein